MKGRRPTVGEGTPADRAERVVLAFGGATIELAAPPGARARIETYLGPYVTRRAELGERPMICVRAGANSEWLRRVTWEARSVESQELWLHGNVLGLRLTGVAGVDRVWNVGENVVYEIVAAEARRTVEFVCETFTKHAILDLARVVRGILSRLAELQSARRVHMSCVSRDGQAVAFVGPRRREDIVHAGRAGWSTAVTGARFDGEGQVKRGRDQRLPSSRTRIAAVYAGGSSHKARSAVHTAGAGGARPPQVGRPSPGVSRAIVRNVSPLHAPVVARTSHGDRGKGGRS